MRNTTVSVVALLVLGLLANGSAQAAERALSSEVKLEPTNQPGVYRATVEIRDARTREMLAAPRVTFLKGEPASTKTSLPSGEEVLFTIQVEASGAAASYTAEIRNGTTSVALQKATVTLAR